MYGILEFKKMSKFREELKEMVNFRQEIRQMMQSRNHFVNYKQQTIEMIKAFKPLDMRIY